MFKEILASEFIINKFNLTNVTNVYCIVYGSKVVHTFTLDSLIRYSSKELETHLKWKVKNVQITTEYYSQTFL